MATLKFLGRVRENVVAVSFNIDGTSAVIGLVACNGQQEDLIVKLPVNCRKLMVECKGNVGEFRVSNCCTVYGDVDTASAGNGIECEGFIQYFPKDKSVRVDRTIKVCHGTEWEKRNNCESFGKYFIVHIEGDLNTLLVNGANYTLDPVVKGNVVTAVAGNMMRVRGVVANVVGVGWVSCTMGESRAKSTDKIVKERRANTEQWGRELGEIFKGVFG